MKAVVFTGPTLSKAEGLRELDAVYLPPVAQGDLYRVALHQPLAIGIIDGYFDWVPSVWHKEILWAMAQGIHLFGSASMGALRAAELASFGMRGVGWIFEAYRDGVLNDDDEVAIVHSSYDEDYGFRVLTEPMVNIRRTLARAVGEGVICEETRESLEEIAKKLFYGDRGYTTVLRLARKQGVVKEEIQAFEAWLPQGRLDQKRQDAVLMLRVMNDFLKDQPGPKQVSYCFQSTQLWKRLRDEAGELRLNEAVPVFEFSPVFTESILDELRLDGDAFLRTLEEAVTRTFLLEEARRSEVRPEDLPLEEAVLDFRRQRGLREPEELDRWMCDNHLTREEFVALMIEEAKCRWAWQRVCAAATRELLRRFRLDSRYSGVAVRAAEKHRLLEELGLQDPKPRDTGISDNDLIRWYLGKSYDCTAADTVTILARDRGFPDEASFWRALRREYCYLKLKNPQALISDSRAES